MAFDAAEFVVFGSGGEAQGCARPRCILRELAVVVGDAVDGLAERLVKLVVAVFIRSQVQLGAQCAQTLFEIK